MVSPSSIFNSGFTLEMDSCTLEETECDCGHQRAKEKAKNILRKYDVKDKYSHLDFSKASILMPLLLRNGEFYVLLTVRSMELKTSPGEVCFPGGRSDPTDRNEIETALREAKEEVGLLAEQVEFVSTLAPSFSKDGAMVTPVVAIVQETFQASPNPEEVTDVFLVPLDYFVAPQWHSTFPLKPGYLRNVLHFFQYTDPETNKVFMIWGLTAHFALMLAVLLLETSPSFDVEYDVDNDISITEQTLLSPSKSKL